VIVIEPLRALVMNRGGSILFPEFTRARVKGSSTGRAAILLKVHRHLCGSGSRLHTDEQGHYHQPVREVTRAADLIPRLITSMRHRGFAIRLTIVIRPIELTTDLVAVLHVPA
jgi:hypothetical protein